MTKKKKPQTPTKATKKSPKAAPKSTAETQPATLDATTSDLDQAQALMEGRFAAQEMFQFLRARMAAFEKNLPEDHEMGVKLANYGVAAEIHVRGMGFQNPSVIEFYGILSDGNEVILVQHIAQLNFMLMAMKPVPEQEPFRIGFEIGDHS